MFSEINLKILSFNNYHKTKNKSCPIFTLGQDLFLVYISINKLIVFHESHLN